MKSPLSSRKSIERIYPRKDILENNTDEQWQFCEQWLFSEIHQQFQKHIGYLDTLEWCLETIEHSPTGRLLLKDVAEQGWGVGFSDLPEQDFTLMPARKLLVLDNYALEPASLQQSDHFRHLVLMNMIRALRDIAHEIHHGGFDKKFGPENILLMERVRTADCHAIAALVGWELRSAGLPEIWRNMIGGEEGDIALAYAQYMESNPSHSFNKKALGAAFHQWFESTARVDECDHDTLEYMDTIMRISKIQDPFGHDRLGPVDIEMLSCLPDKTAYLYAQGDFILRDPGYAGLDDEYNQGHFLQIMHDIQAVFVANVPFRDVSLARRLFPEEFAPRSGETV